MNADFLMHVGDVFLNIAVCLEGYYMLRSKNVPPIQFFIYILFILSSLCWFLWGVFSPNLSQIISGSMVLSIQSTILFVITRRYIKQKIISHQSLLSPIKPFCNSVKNLYLKLFKK
jgi:hypothetical protein